MKKTNLLASCIAMFVAVAAASVGRAAADLQITEIYPGISAGGASDITEDWFELTNFGDMPWVFATDGSLFYDDDSADPTTADLMTLGATEIAAGQSVIYVNGGADGKLGFQNAFPTVDPAIVGYFDGSGLGGSGDAVTVFTGDSAFPDDGIVNEVLLDMAGYPNQDDAVANADAVEGATWDAHRGTWSQAGVAGAFASALTSNVNGLDTPIIGSPGSAVPEPASVALAACAVLGLILVRRRN